MINNGGQSQRSLFEDTGYAVVSKLMNINCLSPIAICKAVFPGMQKRKSGQIVNVLSVAGYLGAPVRSMYCSSKFALDGFCKVLRVEGRAHGVDVIQVYPSYV